MDRPVMNPTFHQEQQPPGRKISLRGRLKAMLVLLAHGLLYDPLRPRRGLKIEDGAFWGRFFRGLGYRLAFTPVIITALVAILVFAGTHPPSLNNDLNPASNGIFFNPIALVSEDTTTLEAWLVPAIDERDVVQEKEHILHKKYPAVILLHDFGANCQSLLPLVKPLHEQAMVVLVLGLRGGGSVTVGQTFGLNEALDVKAAVQMLRHRPFVDPDRIALLGVGTGATAAVLAAQDDQQIKVMVLEDLPQAIEQSINRYITPRESCFAWLRPLCKWAFEIGYRTDAESANVNRLGRILSRKSVLCIDGNQQGIDVLQPSRMKQVCLFLAGQLSEPAKGPVMTRTE